MQDYLSCIVPLVDAWMNIEAPGVAHPNAFVYVPDDPGMTDSPSTCHYEPRSFYYCYTDDNVFMPQDSTWYKYSRFGDVAPLVSLAHELGHRMQHVAGLSLSPQDHPEQEIAVENQADCVAGVFMDYMDRNGFLAPDDMLDFAAGVLDLASPEGVGRDHGTTDQRLRAFYVGYNNGTLVACNPYISDFPVFADAAQQGS